MPVDITCCRICLKSKKVMYPLFVKWNVKPALSFGDLLNDLTNIQVNMGDKLPNRICVTCKQNLEASYKFKHLAESSNRKLLKAFSSNDSMKVEFDDMDDLKGKIETVIPERVQKFVDSMSVLDTKDDIAICNTTIRKCKTEPEDSDNDLEVEYLEEEYLVASDNEEDKDVDYEPPKKKHETARKRNIVKVLAPIKSESSISNANINIKQNVAKRNALPIKGNVSYLPSHSTGLVASSDTKTDTKKKLRMRVPRPSDTEYVSKIRSGYECWNAETLREFQQPKQKEKLICSVCGELTFTLAKHMKTHNVDPADYKKSPAFKKPIPVTKKKLRMRVLAPKKVENAFKIKSGSEDWDTDETSIRVKDKNQPKEKHVCPVCGVLTLTLPKHLLTHQEVKPLKCEQCPKSFSTKTNFEMHMKKHAGIKDQICEICGAAFFFAKSVIRHKLIHKGERPFPCTLCHKRFIANCDLTRHLRVHSGFKPFQCETCNMSFNAKQHLNCHNRIHTGEKPYSCEVCKMNFTYKVNLNNHVFKTHGINLRYKSIHKVTAEIISQEYQTMEGQKPETADNIKKMIMYPQNSP